MSWLRRLFKRRSENSPPASPSRRPLYIPEDAANRVAQEDGTSTSAELRLLKGSKLKTQNDDDGAFDPYNTGAFNRSRSWDKISKHKTR